VSPQSNGLNLLFSFFFLPALHYLLLTGANWLFTLYAKIKNHRFLYDGSRINDDDTPASLEMEDNGNVVSFSPHSSISPRVVLIGPISKTL
jgi:hypothetical protein